MRSSLLRADQLSVLKSPSVPAPAIRTAADDDVLLERLYAVAWDGAGGVEPPLGALPDQPFPPLTAAEVEHVEQQLGYRLPQLVRRIYTEIGDGGFGPQAGLASLMPRRIPGWYIPDWPCVMTLRAAGIESGLPPSWLLLTYGGCTMEWHMSLIAVDNPVLLWDGDGWDPRWGQDAHDGLSYAAPSLREWLWTWADGGDVWAGTLKQPDAHQNA